LENKSSEEQEKDNETIRDLNEKIKQQDK